MNLQLIVKEIREKCPIFQRRVDSSAEMDPISKEKNFKTPTAFVVFEPDQPEPPTSVNDYRQVINDMFAVLVVLDCEGDRLAVDAINMLDEIRAQLLRCLAGYEVEGYDRIEYLGGGEIFEINRSKAYIGYSFTAGFEISHDYTRQGLELDRLPPLQKIKINHDVVDPVFDPNNVQGRPTYNEDQANPRKQGPDGRIEFEQEINFDEN